MSEQLRHKMIDLEVAPPPASWESIAARLDDDKQYHVLAAKMTNAEAIPPSAAWESIASRLQDDKQYTLVSAKMNDFEATPPPQIWNNVLNALEETKTSEVPVINMRRTIYRIAAAAIFIGFFIGGWMLINKNTAAIEVAKNTTTPAVPVPQAIPGKNNPENKVTGNNTPANQKEDVSVTEKNYLPQPVIKSNHSFLPADDYTENPARYAMVSIPDEGRNLSAPSIIAPPILDKNGDPIIDIDVLTTNSNYLVVAGPNGQLTRISSKFANVIRYFNGGSEDTEEYLDRVIKESATWKKRFKEWRNKISQSSYIPSSVNFLDIVEFKDLIQEKQ
jgi:hypothetical protein